MSQVRKQSLVHHAHVKHPLVPESRLFGDFCWTQFCDTQSGAHRATGSPIEQKKKQLKNFL